MESVKNPFNNCYLSPEDSSPESILASARATFHTNPLVMQASAEALESRLAELQGRIAKREKKVAAFRMLAGNSSACSFICPGTGGDPFDSAARLEAEAAMLAHYRLIKEGIERLIELKKQMAEAKK